MAAALASLPHQKQNQGQVYGKHIKVASTHALQIYHCVLPTELYVRGEISIEYPAPGKILSTLSPPLNGGVVWGVGTVYVCTLTYPLRSNTSGEPGRRVFLGSHAQAFL